MAADDIHSKIDDYIDEGADALTRSERARLRKVLADCEKDEAERAIVKEMIKSYERSEWLWGKILSISKYMFLAAGAAVAFKALAGDFLVAFWKALMQTLASRP